jgi:hypothetical protein
MLLTPLPFDYATFLDPGDRLRRTRASARGSRIRREPTRPRA